MHRWPFVLLVLSACDPVGSKDDTGALVEAVDLDGDGFDSTVDCDDSDPAVHPGASEVCNGVDDDCDGFVDDADPDLVGGSRAYPDLDGDGYGDDAGEVGACSASSGFVSEGGDCDDADPAINPGAAEICDGLDNDCDDLVDDDDSDLSGAEVWYADADGDGFGDSAGGVASCEQPSLTVAEGGDCDDADAAIHPGAEEYCNGIDDDCDGEIDEDGALDASTWYLDYDGDGYGGGDYTTESCASPGDDWVADQSDCDDLEPTVYPGADERCDGVDNDCDMLVDEDPVDASTWYSDADGDAYGDPTAGTTACAQPGGTVLDNSDCDDSDAVVNPGATELCNGYDDDCDALVDDADPSLVGGSARYADSDGDGYGNAAVVVFACDLPVGYAAVSGDCNDADATVSPDADETCDGVDNDCDGVSDESDAVGAPTWYADMDGDAYGDPSSATTACSVPSRHVADATDCDDGVAAINPAAAETCNGIDDDCDGLVDDDDPSVSGTSTWYADSDGDGYGDASTVVMACWASSGVVASATDCDDTDAAVNPGAAEACNGYDDDCDGLVDDADRSPTGTSTWYIDADGDGYGDSSRTSAACAQPSGYSAVATDCHDGNASIHPGASEVCDGVDNDCDGLVDDDDGSLSGGSTWYVDADLDGYGDPGASVTACSEPSGYVSDSTDCDDDDADVNPDAIEVCNGYDDDCDGLVDGDDTGLSASATTWYFDGDGDGWGDAGTSTTACSAPSSYVSDSTDCDDSDPGVNPGASEACNGVDDDCDGLVDSVSSCPCNLHRYSGHVYLFCTTDSDWYEAREDCVDNDSYDLVTIDDASEQGWVYSTLASYSTGHFWWIGYNDIDAESWEEPGSAWEWADGSSSTYTNWSSGQPDDWSSGEDCGHIYGSSGAWNDLDCDSDHWGGTYLYFICESG